MKHIHAYLFIILSTIALSVSAQSSGDIFSLAHPERSTWVQSIRVLSPALLSDVNGRFTVTFQAPGMRRASARCVDVLTPAGIQLDGEGRGQFTVSARRLPRGPITIQIFADDEQGKRDVFELQLYNTTRRARSLAGIPDTIPAPARGMQLVFSDDFRSPISISADGRDTRYNAHKPFFGDFSGWPFSDPTPNGPFLQRDDYLIIQARKPEGSRGSTGLLATVDMDGQGFRAQPPFYMECRLVAHSAPGTWPSFWTITNPQRGVGDELDVIEAYGGWGPGAANSADYWVTSHYWEQKDAEGNPLKHPGELIPMLRGRRHTSWSEDFHTYGLYVDREHTIYYLDDEEVCRMATNPVSYEQSHIPLINYAIGGASGWKIDLARYGNASNMYVDYVRVFQKYKLCAQRLCVR